MENIISTSIHITQALDDYNRMQSTTSLAKAGRVPDLIGQNILTVSYSFFIFN